jgi:ubiquinone/menaquinone biosynthesis C-methylase UbiE
MTLSLDYWHQRYQQQAEWTKNLRKYLFDRVEIQNAKKILDVGCGTGVLLAELCHINTAKVYGIDISQNSLRMAKRNVPLSSYTNGDAHDQPFTAGSFDISLCHFLLLWVTNPLTVIIEMARITQEGGYVIAIAEPDYGGRIDYPIELSQVGNWQIESLKKQGANPIIGRELLSLFTQAGLDNIEVGVMGGQWDQQINNNDFALEWEVIRSDLVENNMSQVNVSELKALDLSAREKRHRILFVPTFYAIGKVKH